MSRSEDQEWMMNISNAFADDDMDYLTRIFGWDDPEFDIDEDEEPVAT